MPPRPGRGDLFAGGTCLVFVAAALIVLPRLAGWAVGGVAAGLIAVGGVFWLRSSAKQDTAAEVGRLLMFGLAASLPSLLISHAIDERQKGLERAFASRQRAEDLQLQIGFQHSLAGVTLRGRDLAGFELPQRDLSQADLEGADLRRANLRGANLSGAKLYGARLDGADLTRANLSEAVLTGARLDDAKLFSSDLTGACFASGRGLAASYGPARLEHARLAGADVRDANFAGADLRDARFSEDLRDARDVPRAVFVGAALQRVQWPRGFAGPRNFAASRAQAPSVPVPAGAREDTVVAVSDGDTVLLERAGPAELLGVDAPPLDDPSGWGRRARSFTLGRLRPGARVYSLPALSSEGTRADAFGRRFVFLWRPAADAGDGARRGILFNREIVAEGYAKAALRFSLEPTRQRAEPEATLRREIVDSQRLPKASAQGVWSTCFPA